MTVASDFNYGTSASIYLLGGFRPTIEELAYPHMLPHSI